jgi:hypothetical protein
VIHATTPILDRVPAPHPAGRHACISRHCGTISTIRYPDESKFNDFAEDTDFQGFSCKFEL